MNFVKDNWAKLWLVFVVVMLVILGITVFGVDTTIEIIGIIGTAIAGTIVFFVTVYALIALIDPNSADGP